MLARPMPPAEAPLGEAQAAGCATGDGTDEEIDLHPGKEKREAPHCVRRSWTLTCAGQTISVSLSGTPGRRIRGQERQRYFAGDGRCASLPGSLHSIT